MKDDSWSLRRGAAEALGEIGDKRAVEPLIQVLKNENRDVRRVAVNTLGKLGWKPDNEEEKSWYYMASENWEYCVSLGKIAVEPLIQALKDRGVRKYAAEALGKIRDKQAVEPLIQALKDEDRDVRMSAADALGEIGDKIAIDALIKALSNEDSNNEEREEVAKALRHFETAEAKEALRGYAEDASSARLPKKRGIKMAREAYGIRRIVDGVVCIECPECGTDYNRKLVIAGIKKQSPFLFDFAGWTTKFICQVCRTNIVISSSSDD